MRILVLGAGGTGGYFGGRLTEAGADLTFLVREPRVKILQEHGLVIHSPVGNAQIAVKTVTERSLNGHYDLILLSCKAFDLESAIQAIAPAVGPDTAILPLLNGLVHFDRLDTTFGAERVLGGLCHISAMADPDGAIHHLNRLHFLTFGERAGEPESGRCKEISRIFKTANFGSKLSNDVIQDLWEKFAFLCAGAAITCLMRAHIGAIMATERGDALTRRVLTECQSVAGASGHAIRPKASAVALETLTQAGSTFTASMLRDIEAKHAIEADQIVGDMVRRGQSLNVETTMLEIAYCHLQAYEGMRKIGLFENK